MNAKKVYITDEYCNLTIQALKEGELRILEDDINKEVIIDIINSLRGESENVIGVLIGTLFMIMSETSAVATYNMLKGLILNLAKKGIMKLFNEE